MLVLIDNYDSFTYNLYHYLCQLGATVKVYRNDAITVPDLFDLEPEAIVISPGPCDPDRAGICLDTIAEAARRGTPLLGVCLGHQAIGQAFGGKVVRVAPMHGKVSAIHHRQPVGPGHNQASLFRHIPSPFNATRYHSLTVERDSFPETLAITAETEDGTVMGLQHRSLPIFGVQFHPESIASEHGHRLLANFMENAGLKPAQEPLAA